MSIWKRHWNPNLISRRTLSACDLCCTVAALLAGVLLNTAVHADIRIEQDDGVVQLSIEDETMASIVAELADHFDFSVDGDPTHWTDERLSFTASGNLETVLNRVLADTSHVYGYTNEVIGGPVRIASVKLLNIGSPGPMFDPQISSQGPTKDVLRDPLPRGQLPGRSRDGLTLTDEADQAGGQTANNPTEQDDENSTQVANTGSSSLSQTLEQRARQATGQADGLSPPSSANTDIQSLTQKALQDVQNLADALRNAEQGNN